MDDTRVADQNYRAFKRAYDNGHEDYVERAKKCDDFYLSEQWDEGDLAILGDRPALTINMIQLAVDTILGHYSTTQADFLFKPKGATPPEQAEMITKVFGSILDANDYHKVVEPQVFSDGIIEERGFFDVRLDFNDNIYGNIRLRSLDPKKCLLDPDAVEYDPATWNEFTYTDWYDLNTVQMMWGKEAAEKVQAYTAHEQTYGQESVRFSGETESVEGVDVEHSKTVRSIRVVERQHRRLSMVREFVEPTTGETRPVPESWDEARVQKAVQSYGLFTRKRMQSRVRWTVTADHITLHDDWSLYDDFTVVPYFPIFRRGRPSGYVTHMLSPQEQFNKIESQNLHVINSTANSGWIVEEGSLRNMTVEDLEERGAEHGLVLVHAKGRQAPEKIAPNTIPSGLENASQKSFGHLREISRVGSLMGTVEHEVSGVALSKTQAKALTAVQPFLDKLSYSRTLLAKRILSLIQKYYTEPRLIRWTNWRDPKLQTEEFYVNTMNTAGEIINNLTLGEYDIVVSSAPARDTFEDSQFAEALQLREQGIAVPDHRVVQYSHLSDKADVVEEIKQLTGFAEPTEQEMRLQQMQQEIMLREALAQVGELEAKALNLQADAQLKQAKAEATFSEEERTKMQAAAELREGVAKLRADLMKHMTDLRNKVDLADRHIAAKKDLTRYTTMAKALQESMKAKQPPTPNSPKANERTPGRTG